MFAPLQVDDRLTTVLDIESRLQRFTELSELYQAREAIFLLPMTEYPQVSVLLLRS
jgi:putative methionine-R-sulfoxide reductase with GAF domain